MCSGKPQVQMVRDGPMHSPPLLSLQDQEQLYSELSEQYSLLSAGERLEQPLPGTLPFDPLPR